PGVNAMSATDFTVFAMLSTFLDVEPARVFRSGEEAVKSATRRLPAPMDEYLAENRALWDAWTGIHLDSSFYDVASFISGKDPIRVKDYEREEIGDVSGKSLLHLQCHFGLDTLSWARLGARVTGADFSPQSIDAARRLAADVDVPATFVCSNLFDLPQNLDAAGMFDVV